jgi:hypothetical protein
LLQRPVGRAANLATHTRGVTNLAMHTRSGIEWLRQLAAAAPTVDRPVEWAAQRAASPSGTEAGAHPPLRDGEAHTFHRGLQVEHVFDYTPHYDAGRTRRSPRQGVAPPSMSAATTATPVRIPTTAGPNPRSPGPPQPAALDPWILRTRAAPQPRSPAARIPAARMYV